MAKGKLKGQGNSLSSTLTKARNAETRALKLAKDVKTLVVWLERDILALAGPCFEDRRELFDFIVKRTEIAGAPGSSQNPSYARHPWAAILRFFLNHRVFMRNGRPERVGKSPTEFKTGKPHPHWLELLGFKLFRRPLVYA